MGAGTGRERLSSPLTRQPSAPTPGEGCDYTVPPCAAAACQAAHAACRAAPCRYAPRLPPCSPGTFVPASSSTSRPSRRPAAPSAQASLRSAPTAAGSTPSAPRSARPKRRATAPSATPTTPCATARSGLSAPRRVRAAAQCQAPCFAVACCQVLPGAALHRKAPCCAHADGFVGQGRGRGWAECIGRGSILIPAPAAALALP